MEKEKNGKTLAIIALFVAIVGLSVGFAALSTTLTINGTGTVKTSKWDIHFANLGATPGLTGSAEEVTAPTLTDTTVQTFDVSFTAPADSVTYTFDVVNDGSYDAKISSVTIPTPQCTGTGDNATTDATNVCNNLSYTLKYEDGTTVSTNDTLAIGETKHLVLKLEYLSSVTADLLPTANVTISGLQIPIVYVQK